MLFHIVIKILNTYIAFELSIVYINFFRFISVP